MSASRTDFAAELARCDREIAEILERPDVAAGQVPAWLVALGIADWESERRLIAAEQAAGRSEIKVAARGRVGAVPGVQAALPAPGVLERFGTGFRPKK